MKNTASRPACRHGRARILSFSPFYQPFIVLTFFRDIMISDNKMRKMFRVQHHLPFGNIRVGDIVIQDKTAEKKTALGGLCVFARNISQKLRRQDRSRQKFPSSCPFVYFACPHCPQCYSVAGGVVKSFPIKKSPTQTVFLHFQTSAQQFLPQNNP